jgi:sodium-dependent dicarboxylate transporter 2/3/5
MDTRKAYGELMGRLEFSSWRGLAKALSCLVVAYLLAYLPEHAGLSDAGRASLFILILAAGLWISEAMPAFAVALLVIGLQILILGRPGGVFAGPEDADLWQAFSEVWAAPPMWLFFAGLVMAKSAERTGLADWIARGALAFTGGRGERVLWVAMALTFVFSMFISNTATAALMVAILGPLLGTAGGSDPRTRAGLLVGIAFAANLGGMGTIIGTPPNAIAAGLLADDYAVSFLQWMELGLPPALVLVVLTAATLAWRRGLVGLVLDVGSTEGSEDDVEEAVPLWQRLMVIVIFVVTITLWLTERRHGMPTAVVSFIPIVALSMIGVIRREEMRSLPWDILLLLAGGLSLGVGIAATGLASWLAEKLLTVSETPWLLALLLAYAASGLSNLMSNTAAANLLLPIALAAGLEFAGPVGAAQFAVPVALAASSAMCLPISTPPNALAYATGHLELKDLAPGGLVIGLIAPPLSVFWCFWLL